MGYGRDEIEEMTRAGEDLPDEAKLTQLYQDLLAGKGPASAWWSDLVAKQKAGDKDAERTMQAFEQAKNKFVASNRRHRQFG